MEEGVIKAVDSVLKADFTGEIHMESLQQHESFPFKALHEFVKLLRLLANLPKLLLFGASC